MHRRQRRGARWRAQPSSSPAWRRGSSGSRSEPTASPLFNQPVNIRNQFGTGVATIMQPIGVCVPTEKLAYTLLP